MKTIFKILVLFLLVIACDNDNTNGLKAFGDSNINAFTSSSELLEEVITTGKAGATQRNSSNLNVQRKLIKNGNISFETEDLNETKSNIIGLVKQYNGYISSDNQNGYGNRKSINLIIRIPTQHFDSILSGISKNVSKFDNKDIRISDVTEEFLDVESRIKNKKELEKTYLDILKKAKSVKDILEVERELGKLREEIEAKQGRLKYLQNQVSFSTLTINFYKTVSSSTSFGKKVSDGFSNGFENLKGFFIGLINVWPFIIIISFALILIRRRFKKKKK